MPMSNTKPTTKATKATRPELTEIVGTITFVNSNKDDGKKIDPTKAKAVHVGLRSIDASGSMVYYRVTAFGQTGDEIQAGNSKSTLIGRRVIVQGRVSISNYVSNGKKGTSREIELADPYELPDGVIPFNVLRRKSSFHIEDDDA